MSTYLVPAESSEKSSEKILSLVKMESTLSAREIAIRLGITQRAVEKQIARLRKDGRLKRVGPAKGGHWDVSES
jgi:ATP-dependent DNA helicase RecG